MGIFNGITKYVKKVIAPSNIGAAITGIMKPLTVAVVHPIQTISAVISPTKTVKQVIEKHFEAPVKKQVIEAVLAGATYTGAAFGISAITAGAKAGTLATAAKTLIPKTVKGKVIGSFVALAGTGALISQPAKTLGTIAGTPSKIAEFGGGISTLIAEPSFEHAKELFKESPILTTLAAAGAVAVVGGGIGLAANTVSTMLNTKATKENSTGGVPQTTTGQIPTETGKVISEKTRPTDMGIPETPQTTTITTAKRRRYKAKIKEKPSVRQNVHVIVQNRAIGIRNERFIRERVFA